jgi:hypothetical protein
LTDKRQQDRRDNVAGPLQAIKRLLYKFGILVMHPSKKARDEYRDTTDERDRRNRRTRRDNARDEDRRTDSRRG